MTAAWNKHLLGMSVALLTRSVFCRLACVWTHLVLLPSPEEVDRPVLPPLDDRPASLSPTLLAPGLQEAVGALRAEQVDPAGGLT